MAQPYGALAENIALLSLLSPKSEYLKYNPVPETFRDEAVTSDGCRVLSFKHEQQTAKAFAILLSVSDDPKTVGAVCIEEGLDRESLVIRTAVNSGSQESRKSVFRAIARTLQGVSRAGS